MICYCRYDEIHITGISFGACRVDRKFAETIGRIYFFLIVGPFLCVCLYSIDEKLSGEDTCKPGFLLNVKTGHSQHLIFYMK